MAELTTTAAVKAFLGITHNADDGLIDGLVTAASDYLETQVGRTFAATSYSETQDGCGGRVIVPCHSPVTAVSSVKVNGETISTSTGYGVDGYYLDGDVIRLRGYFVSQGYGNVEIAYTAGYASTPADVSQAATEMAALMYRERERVGQQSRNGPDGSTVFYYTPPARVVATIEAYRRPM